MKSKKSLKHHKSCQNNIQCMYSNSTVKPVLVITCNQRSPVVKDHVLSDPFISSSIIEKKHVLKDQNLLFPMVDLGDGFDCTGKR